MKRSNPIEMLLEQPPREQKPRLTAGQEFSPGEPPEGAPAWIISFADMVLLMMGFFVLLFALSKTPKGRLPGGSSPEDDGAHAQVSVDLLDLAISIREAFHNPVQVSSTDPTEQELVERLRQREASGEAFERGLTGLYERVQSPWPTEYYTITGSAPFDEQSLIINAAARQTIEEFAQEVRGLRLIIEVCSHVSALESMEGEEAAFELSSKRAHIVAKALSELGIDRSRMRLVIAADHHQSEQRSNARVELTLTDNVVPGSAHELSH